MDTLEGNMEITAMTAIFAEYYEEYFNKTTEFFQENIFQFGFINFMLLNQYDCRKVFKNSVLVPDESLLN